MPYSIELPDGRIVRGIPDDIDPDRAKALIAQRIPELAEYLRDDTFTDILKEVGAGAAGLGEMITGDIPLLLGAGENRVGKFFGELREDIKGTLSPAAQLADLNINAAIAEAGKQGLSDQFIEALKQYATNPGAAIRLMAEQAPQLLLALGAGAGAGLVTKGMSAAARSAAQVGAAVGSESLLQGGDIGGDAYERLKGVWKKNPEYFRSKPEFAEYLSQSMTEEQAADRIALSQARGAAVTSGAIVAGLGFGPGGTIYRTLFKGGEKAAKAALPKTTKQALIQIGKVTSAEVGSEGLEEGPFGQGVANLFVRNVDPTQSLTEDVGAAAAQGMVAALGPGAVAGTYSAARDLGAYRAQEAQKAAEAQAEEARKARFRGVGDEEPGTQLGFPGFPVPDKAAAKKAAALPGGWIAQEGVFGENEDLGISEKDASANRKAVYKAVEKRNAVPSKPADLAADADFRKGLLSPEPAHWAFQQPDPMQPYAERVDSGREVWQNLAAERQRALQAEEDARVAALPPMPQITEQMDLREQPPAPPRVAAVPFEGYREMPPPRQPEGRGRNLRLDFSDPTPPPAPRQPVMREQPLLPGIEQVPQRPGYFQGQRWETDPSGREFRVEGDQGQYVSPAEFRTLDQNRAAYERMRQQEAAKIGPPAPANVVPMTPAAVQGTTIAPTPPAPVATAVPTAPAPVVEPPTEIPDSSPPARDTRARQFNDALAAFEDSREDLENFLFDAWANYQENGWGIPKYMRDAYAKYDYDPSTDQQRLSGYEGGETVPDDAAALVDTNTVPATPTKPTKKKAGRVNYLDSERFVYHAVRNDEDIGSIVKNGLSPGSNVSTGLDGQAFNEGETILVFDKEDVVYASKAYQNDATITNNPRPVAILKDTEPFVVLPVDGERVGAEYDRIQKTLESIAKSLGIDKDEFDRIRWTIKSKKAFDEAFSPDFGDRVRELTSEEQRVFDDLDKTGAEPVSNLDVLNRYTKYGLPVQEVKLEVDDDGNQSVSGGQRVDAAALVDTNTVPATPAKKRRGKGAMADENRIIPSDVNDLRMKLGVSPRAVVNAEPGGRFVSLLADPNLDPQEIIFETWADLQDNNKKAPKYIGNAIKLYDYRPWEDAERLQQWEARNGRMIGQPVNRAAAQRMKTPTQERTQMTPAEVAEANYQQQRQERDREIREEFDESARTEVRPEGMTDDQYQKAVAWWDENTTGEKGKRLGPAFEDLHPEAAGQWLYEFMDYAPTLDALDRILKYHDQLKNKSDRPLRNALKEGGDRRSTVISRAAALAAAPTDVNGKPIFSKAVPIPKEVIGADIPKEAIQILNTDNKVVENGLERVHLALDIIIRQGESSLRPLARKIKQLLPTTGKVLFKTVDSQWVSNHGAVRMVSEFDSLPLMSLSVGNIPDIGFNGRGYTYEVFLHESLHLALGAKYHTLRVMGTSMADRLGPAPNAKKSLEQFDKIWQEFRSLIISDPALVAAARENTDNAISIRTSYNSPDEFFVRAITDPRFQSFLDTKKYEGKSLWDRFKDWVKQALLGKSAAPSWLDVALAATDDVIDASSMDPSDWSRVQRAAEIIKNNKNAGKGYRGKLDYLAQAREQHVDGRPLTEQHLRAIANQFLVGRPNSPTVHIIRTMAEAPGGAQAEFRAQQERGAVVAWPAFWHNGQVWLVAENIRSEAGAVTALAHEIEGHHGLRGFFGDALEDVLQDVVKQRKEDVEIRAVLSGWDVNDPTALSVAAEEVVSYIAQTQPNLNLIQRLVARIRKFLSDNGFDLKLSDNDIIYRFVLPAQKYVREQGASFGKSPADIAAQARTLLDSEEFKKEFEKSVIRTESGAPRLVVHATIRDYDPNSMRTDSELGAHFGTPEQATDRVTTRSGGEVANEARSIPAFLIIKNPLRLEDRGGFSPMHVMPQLMDMGLLSDEDSLRLSQKPDPEILRDIKLLLESEGYDGVVYLNRVEGILRRDNADYWREREDLTDDEFSDRYPEATDSYIVFRAKQVVPLFRNRYIQSDYLAQTITDPVTADDLINRYAPTTLNKVNDLKNSLRDVVFGKKIEVGGKVARGTPGWLSGLADMRAPIRDKMKLAQKAFFDPTNNEVRADLHLDIADKAISTLAAAALEYGPADVDQYGLAHVPMDDPNRASYRRIIDRMAALEKEQGIKMHRAVGMLNAALIGKRAAAVEAGDVEARRRVRKLGVPENEQRLADEIWDANPWIAEVYGMMREHLNGQIDFLVKTGKIPQAKANEWKAATYYVPFYRVFEKEALEPENKKVAGLNSPMEVVRNLTGGDREIGDVLTGMMRQSMFMTAAGVKSNAVRATAKQLVDLGLAKYVPPKVGANGKNYHAKFFDTNGKEVAVRFNNPEDAQAISYIEQEFGPLMKYLQRTTGWLRSGIIRMPDYMVRDLYRNLQQSYFMAGDQKATLLKTMFRGTTLAARNLQRNVAGGLSNRHNKPMSPGEQFLKSHGIAGGWELMGDMSELDKLAAHYGPTVGKTTRFWRKLMDINIDTDLASKEQLFESLSQQGVHPVEAMYRAYSIAPFSQRGRNGLVRTVSSMMPFVQANIKGLHMLYQLLTGDPYSMPIEQRQAARKMFIARGVQLAIFTALYTMLMADDDLHESQNDTLRDMNFIFPMTDKLGLRLPIAPEVGLLFKIPVERMTRAMMGDKHAWDNFGDTATNFVPFWGVLPTEGGGGPQLIRPWVEVATNHSFFQNRPIVPEALKRLPEEEQFTAYTSALSRNLAPMIGMSPMKADYLIRGMFGTAGTFALFLADSLAKPFGVESAPTAVTRMPGLTQGLFANDMGSRQATLFYELKAEADRAASAFNKMVKEGRIEDATKYYDEYRANIAVRKYLNKMADVTAKLREQQRAILRDPNMGREEKLRRSEEYTRAINDLLKQARVTAELTGIER